MRILAFTFILGFIVLYFVNIALLGTPMPDMEWTVHAGIRFLIGFFVLGISYFYAKALRFKIALQITLSLVLLDYLYDYYVEAYKLNFEIILHGIYMLTWGALTGYLVAEAYRK